MKGITMITLERTSVMNMENALRGARNPLNSWNRTDSFYDEQGRYILGPNDLNLAKASHGRQRPPQICPSDPRICRHYSPALLVERI